MGLLHGKNMSSQKNNLHRWGAMAWPYEFSTVLAGLLRIVFYKKSLYLKTIKTDFSFNNKLY